MVEKEQIFAKLDELEEKYIDFWADICRIESPTNNKAAVDKACEYVVRKAADMGWKTEVMPEGVSGNPVCITMNGEAGGAPVILSGHMDTVHPIGLFGEEAVKIEDGKIYGPGVMDCKGGVAAAFYAMEALAALGFNSRPVKLILQTDEENSSRTSEKRTIAFMCKKSEGARAFLNLEGSASGKACVERKGIIRYDVEVEGVAVHSSMCYDGSSAIREAAHKIIELEKIQEERGLTFSCGVISGGTADNTVPEKCNFTIDVRFKDYEQMNFAQERIAQIVSTSYIGNTTATFKVKSKRPPMVRKKRNLALLEELNSIYENAGIGALEPASRTGGSDAAYITECGIPCIDNLGPEGGYIHSRKEYAYLSSLKESAAKQALAVAYLK